MQALLLHSDPVVAQDLTDSLKIAGFNVERGVNSDDTMRMLRHYRYDFILLNSDLVDISGYDLLCRIRTSKCLIPVMLLTESLDARSRLRAFASGADDILEIPFGNREFVARSHAITRTSKGYVEKVMVSDTLRLNFDAQKTWVNDQPVPLTQNEQKVLQLLILFRGTYIPKDTILDYLYRGRSKPHSGVVPTYVCKIRTKLKAVSGHDIIIDSHPKGYILRKPSKSP